MLIDEKALIHWIDNFYGYGSWHARFWFVNYEEGGGEIPEEVADKLNYFYKLKPETDGTLCDIRDLYRHVAVRWDGPKANSFGNLFEYRFDQHAILHGVWKNIIAFTHGYKQEKLPDLLNYQRNSFLSRTTRSEALIQLYPLPSPHNHGWYYSWLDLPNVHFLKTRALYQKHVFERRIHQIVSNINTYKPEMVLMYGMDNINSLKKSVQTHFEGANFKMIKQVKRQIPQHHRADLNGTTMLITTQIPALRHNRIETGFVWEDFGRQVADTKIIS